MTARKIYVMADQPQHDVALFIRSELVGYSYPITPEDTTRGPIGLTQRSIKEASVVIAFLPGRYLTQNIIAYAQAYRKRLFVCTATSIRNVLIVGDPKFDTMPNPAWFHLDNEHIEYRDKYDLLKSILEKLAQPLDD